MHKGVHMEKLRKIEGNHHKGKRNIKAKQSAAKVMILMTSIKCMTSIKEIS